MGRWGDGAMERPGERSPARLYIPSPRRPIAPSPGRFPAASALFSERLVAVFVGERQAAQSFGRGDFDLHAVRGNEGAGVARIKADGILMAQLQRDARTDVQHAQAVVIN